MRQGAVWHCLRITAPERVSLTERRDDEMGVAQWDRA